MAVDATRKKTFRLFNPRRDKWEKHFRWNYARTQVIGLTAIGRTTIMTLQLNHTLDPANNILVSLWIFCERHFKAMRG